ncbi:hypothetical protein K474DRAFT_1684383 [Panus rudis PR-1116 ss-1]|nr:hypothetical protein K474DRAFT_1684383 [Panus rudis PR-1116 ss-1]
MVNELLGPLSCSAYDIGCKFLQTILYSSLGEKFCELRNKFCVNTFHWYSHGYSCQRCFHPSRVFSTSNQLTPVIHHASAYRQRLFIDLFFTQWHNEKYTNVANMLYENYEAFKKMKITEANLETYENKETEYINTLDEESDADIFATTYVKLLAEMDKIKASLETSTARFIHSMPDNYNADVFRKLQAYTASLSVGKKINSQHCALSGQLDHITHEVCNMEAAWGITRQWESTDKEYIKAI